MSWLTTKSKLLLGAALLMGGLTLIPAQSLDPQSDLPALAKVERADVQRIEITVGQGETVVMEGNLEEGFQVVAPYSAPADTIALRPLLSIFEREKTRMDLAVDEGNLEQYGLDDAQGVLVELFADDPDTPAVAFIVGKDRPGGASFVRLPGSDTVYRGKVGTRARYARDPLDWRDKMVAQVPAGLVQEIRLQPLDGPELVFYRLPEGDMGTDESSHFGAWTSDHQDYALDQKSVDAAVKSLAELRAGRIFSGDTDGGFAPPALTASLLMVDGEQLTFEFGSRLTESGAAYVRRSDRDAVYLVSSAVRERLLRPAIAYRNRVMFSFLRVDVATYTLVDSLGTAVLAQDPNTNMWAFTQPANMDTDVLAVTQSINTLGELRADAIDPEISQADAGLEEPVAVLKVRFFNGGGTELWIGKQIDINGTPYTYIARPELLPLIYLVRSDSVSHLRAAFNRSE